MAGRHDRPPGKKLVRVVVKSHETRRSGAISPSHLLITSTDTPLPSPTVHSAPGSNTLAIYGSGSNKDLTELVPGILNQLGPDSLASLRKLAEYYSSLSARQQAAAAGEEGDKEADEDDEIPQLVENFDDVEEKKDENKLEELN